jgi:hypothetical protein
MKLKNNPYEYKEENIKLEEIYNIKENNKKESNKINEIEKIFEDVIVYN